MCLRHHVVDISSLVDVVSTGPTEANSSDRVASVELGSILVSLKQKFGDVLASAMADVAAPPAAEPAPTAEPAPAPVALSTHDGAASTDAAAPNNALPESEAPYRQPEVPPAASEARHEVAAVPLAGPARR